MQPAMSERIGTSIRTVFRAGCRQGRGRVRNVSHGGLFVRTRALPQEGESVDLSLRTLAGVPIRLSGVVWWTTREGPGPNGASGFGLRLFDEDSEDLRRLLESL